MMAESPVTLDFLAAQQQRILDEMSAIRVEMSTIRGDILMMKDDISVLSAMAIRQDRATKTVIERLDLLTGRFGERLRRLEEQQEA
jgi:hypothetical protein